MSKYTKVRKIKEKINKAKIRIEYLKDSEYLSEGVKMELREVYKLLQGVNDEILF